MEQNRTISLSTTTLGFITFLVFLVLRLTNVVDWNWFWVFFPLWIPIASIAAVFLIVFIIMLFVIIFKKEN